jgi:hypothetical protein
VLRPEGHPGAEARRRHSWIVERLRTSYDWPRRALTWCWLLTLNLRNRVHPRRWHELARALLDVDGCETVINDDAWLELTDTSPSRAARNVRTVPLSVAFAGGEPGAWRVDRIEAVVGEPLPFVPRLEVVEGSLTVNSTAKWVLRGVTSNQRYTDRAEAAALAAKQQPLGRPEMTRAALIPITKSEAWWQLSQDERRVVFEDRSHHIAVGLEYLPAIARRLNHGRDVSGEFDFLTWFEYPDTAEADFEELVVRLRSTPEWEFVEREIDIRLYR